VTALQALLARAEQQRAAGRLHDAEAALAQAAQMAPQQATVLCNHGLLLAETGRPQQALERLRQALALDPRLAAAWVNLALALRQLGDLPGAEAAQRRALALDPRAPQPHVHAGLSLQAQGRLLEAQGAYRYALALDARLPESWINLGIALLDSGDAAGAQQALRQALALAPADRRAASNLLMSQQYDPALDAATLRGSAARLGALWNRPGPPCPPPPAGPRLRLGYLGADFRQHPVGWLLAPVLAAHDRDAVEVHVFDHQLRPGDALTAQLRAAAEHWHEVGALGDEALCAHIRQQAIDVLIDLSGHTEHHRLGVMAQRAAPVQLSWLGYFASTGLAAIDACVLGDTIAGPGGEAFHCEALERLPRPHFAYTPPAYTPPCAPEPPSVHSGCITFGSFNNPAKLGDEVLRVWAQVLQRVPGSRLALRWKSLGDPAFAAQMRQRLAVLGIDPARVLTLPALPHAELLAAYGEIDIALDPFPFSGLMTTLEALLMGVPVLTLPWLRPVSRQTLAIVQALGLPELAATTPQAYVERAAALADDLALRRIWRSHPQQGLRARLGASPLGDGAGLARALEAVARRRLAEQTATAGATAGAA
jgi:predicted O-linked N-acetylglucosamine transferase (SPINDLY family)